MQSYMYFSASEDINEYKIMVGVHT